MSHLGVIQPTKHFISIVQTFAHNECHIKGSRMLYLSGNDLETTKSNDINQVISPLWLEIKWKMSKSSILKSSSSNDNVQAMQSVFSPLFRPFI